MFAAFTASALIVLSSASTSADLSENVTTLALTDSRRLDAVSFIVTVGAKTSSHASFGSGSSVGYFIDAQESPALRLEVGKTYKFDQSDSSNKLHTLRFYTHASKVSSWLVGAEVTVHGTAGSVGAYTEITASSAITTFYQCENHGFMGHSAEFTSNALTTTAPISANCQAWCPRSTRSWSEKCGWSRNCNECSECGRPAATQAPTAVPSAPPSTTENCKVWCPRNSQSWSVKCGWPRNCNECSECDGLSTTTPLAPTRAPTAATHAPTAVPSAPPSTAENCKVWCPRSTESWSVKCGWSQNCNECSECDSINPPSCTSVRYISTSGSDGNSGCTENDALESLAVCIARVGNGGVCYIMPGRYHFEPIQVKGKNDLTIAAAPGSDPGSVIIDGTAPIEGGWDLVNGQYISKQAQHVWQLFVGGRPLTPARWPNALMWTDDAWNQDLSWATTTNERDGNASGTFCGHTVDMGTTEAPEQTLADTGISFNGCNLIMNNEHWDTRRYTVKNHAAGSSSFDYDVPQSDQSTCEKYADDGKAKYFLDGCLAALDAPGEWAYNADSRLVVLPFTGSESVEFDVRGKDQTYVLLFDECERIKISGVTFFATTMASWNSKGIDISNNIFLYQSSSRRSMGGDVEEFDLGSHFGILDLAVMFKSFKTMHMLHVPTLAIFGRRGEIGDGSSTATLFRDNVINHSEGSGIYCRFCKDDVFENNILEEVGYPFGRGFDFPNDAVFVDPAFSANVPNDARTSKGNITVTRNTITTDGAGAINKLMGPDVVASYNHVSNSGRLIVDSEGIGGGKASHHNVIKYNWVRDSKGLGIRYDCAEDGVFPHANGIIFNVAWGDVQGGVTQKSTQAVNYRNTAIDNQGGGAFGSAPDMKIYACYPHNCKGINSLGEEVTAHTNVDSITRGNVGQLDSTTTGRDKTDLPGTSDHNLNLLSSPIPFDVLFRDYKNWDFRPRMGSPLIDTGSTVNTVQGRAAISWTPDGVAVQGESIVGSAPDLGAYEAGDSSYWIPGALQSKASTPIPPHNATNVKPDADLMWLQAKSAAHYVIYLAEAKDGSCEYADLPSKGVSHPSSSNIFKPDTPLIPSTLYCWSIDVVTSSGATVKGDLWEFTVGCQDLFCNACGISPTVGSCVSCEAPFQMVEGSGVCSPAGGCLGGVWTVVATPDKAFAQTYTVNSPGQTTDTFEVREVSSTACLRWGIDTTLSLYKISAGGPPVEIRMMGCNNKKYALLPTFSCTAGCYAPAGFAADPTAASGCSLQRRLVPDSQATDTATLATADMTVLATLEADDGAAAVFGIVCGCMALILATGCVATLRWKKCCMPTQVLRTTRCDADDLEGASCTTQTEP